MNIFGHIWRWLLSVMRRGRYEREMEEEMRFHLEMQIEQNLASGMASEEARDAARRQFGNQTWLKEVSREMWSLNSIETLIQDLRYGVRMLMRRPSFALIVTLTLGLGIGANTAVYSVVDATLLKPLPYAEPDRLVVIYGGFLTTGDLNMVASASEYYDYREQTQSFESLGAYLQLSANLAPEGAGEPERVEGGLVTPEMFSALKASIFRGRVFLICCEE